MHTGMDSFTAYITRACTTFIWPLLGDFTIVCVNGQNRNE